MATTISMAEVRSFADSKPTVDIVWRETEDSKVESHITLSEKIPLALTQALSTFCVNAVNNTELGPSQHLKHPILLTGGKIHSYSLVFQWMSALTLNFNLLRSYEFDIAPLYQAHKLLEAADYLGVPTMKPFILKKIDQIQTQPFMLSEVIPILLTNGPYTPLFDYVVKGVSTMIIDGHRQPNDKDIMVMRSHYPVFAVEVDEMVENKRVQKVQKALKMKGKNYYQMFSGAYSW